MHICFSYAQIMPEPLYLGKAKSNAKTELEKLKMKDLTCAELIKETTSGLASLTFNLSFYPVQNMRKTDSQMGMGQIKCVRYLFLFWGGGFFIQAHYTIKYKL